MTVFWHVDDLKVLHEDPKEVTIFMDLIEGVYREMIITRGKVNKYLGMTLDFRTQG